MLMSVKGKVNNVTKTMSKYVHHYVARWQRCSKSNKLSTQADLIDQCKIGFYYYEFCDDGTQHCSTENDFFFYIAIESLFHCCYRHNYFSINFGIFFHKYSIFVNKTAFFICIQCHSHCTLLAVVRHSSISINFSVLISLFFHTEYFW